MKNFAALPKPTETTDLEFPDWSGMDESTSRVDVATAFRCVERYRLWFPEAVARWLSDRPSPCPMEFVLTVTAKR